MSRKCREKRTEQEKLDPGTVGQVGVGAVAAAGSRAMAASQGVQAYVGASEMPALALGSHDLVSRPCTVQ